MVKRIFLNADNISREKEQKRSRQSQEKPDKKMNANCFFGISLLFLLWITTLVAFVIFIRKEKRREKLRLKVENNDLLLGLFSQKAMEAKIAVERLSRVADELGIGLIENVPGRITLANKWAKRFCPEEAEDQKSFDEFLKANVFPCTIRRSGRVIEVRRLEAANRSILLLQDVTEGYRLARKVKEKERLAFLGQMSAQVAHQIKTPLSILAGRAQMLARHLPVGSKERKQAEALFEESRILARQVNQIVSFYKEPEPEYSKVYVKELLREILDRLSSIETDCAVEIDAPEELSATTDMRLLSNALFLVSQNSLSPDTGADLVKIRAERVSDSVKITICDNGKGLEKETLTQIFEPFFTTRQEGLGLGLFMARDILARIGCKIEVVASYQGGAKFEIIIPPGGQEGETAYHESLNVNDSESQNARSIDNHGSAERTPTT